MSKTNKRTLTFSIVVALVAAALGALLTMGENKLIQPSFTPPGWVFSVVWTILFILMGISSYLVFTAKCEYEDKRFALTVYGVQLVVNVLWSALYFRLAQPFLAFVWLILLWCLILLMIFAFNKCSKKAALLQIPYLAWVTFAAWLNWATVVLNR